MIPNKNGRQIATKNLSEWKFDSDKSQTSFGDIYSQIGDWNKNYPDLLEEAIPLLAERTSSPSDLMHFINLKPDETFVTKAFLNTLSREKSFSSSWIMWQIAHKMESKEHEVLAIESMSKFAENFEEYKIVLDKLPKTLLTEYIQLIPVKEAVIKQLSQTADTFDKCLYAFNHAIEGEDKELCIKKLVLTAETDSEYQKIVSLPSSQTKKEGLAKAVKETTDAERLHRIYQTFQCVLEECLSRCKELIEGDDLETSHKIFEKFKKVKEINFVSEEQGVLA